MNNPLLDDLVLIGYDDGRRLEDPVDSGAITKPTLFERSLVADEQVTVETYDSELNSKRFGLPIFYKVSFYVPGIPSSRISVKVHHTRIQKKTKAKPEQET